MDSRKKTSAIFGFLNSRWPIISLFTLYLFIQIYSFIPLCLFSFEFDDNISPHFIFSLNKLYYIVCLLFVIFYIYTYMMPQDRASSQYILSQILLGSCCYFSSIFLSSLYLDIYFFFKREKKFSFIMKCLSTQYPSNTRENQQSNTLTLSHKMEFIHYCFPISI